MSWYKRFKESITTRDKKTVPDGVWHNCPKCKKTTPRKQFEQNLCVCPNCDYHNKIGALQYFDLLFDGGENDREMLFEELRSYDLLGFVDERPYGDRLAEAQEKTGLDEALQAAVGSVNGRRTVICAMDFAFIGGSMGLVAGERIARSIDHCIAHRLPLVIVSKSGGARMMEAAFSLMQMAKTAAKLSLLDEAKLPYISVMTDPTTGGVSASFAMLGDLNIAEPGALIGFAGPRIIKDTIKEDLPDGFQASESVLEHGFLDLVVHRHKLKATLSDLLEYFDN